MHDRERAYHQYDPAGLAADHPAQTHRSDAMRPAELRSRLKKSRSRLLPKADWPLNNDLNAADRATINNYNNIKSVSGQTIVHNRPIVLYFNRYEMSNINAWDGNKIETGDGSYLLAPQVGAGIKENDNSFTGIMMGDRKSVV